MKMSMNIVKIEMVIVLYLDKMVAIIVYAS